MNHKHGSTRRYVTVYLALVGLTALSFGLSWLHLGTVDTVIALLIAVVKSTLVVLFFMHLLEHRTVSGLVLGCTVFFIALLTSLMAADVATRINSTPAPFVITGESEGGSESARESVRSRAGESAGKR
ncbi:cytochrome C oxidase subunit IV family protein [Chondromyces apiculatus]|uniref:Cytochrome c oxidase polypeptide IV n=1 Tax=Chondromyces apiculatus DSM 436 TaxID=1192034 RepID=A0A017TCB2_9BACT|nr:cytochrome C oxidase subunit IV family protein [Chondromyces apiculatus]EYF06923.1 Cytochrome c oxidase polypeptide IV [Chondromyces apiculatus DSM 436]